MEFKHRDKEFTEAERALCKSIKLSPASFQHLFDVITISELLPNTNKRTKIDRTPTSGILFFGKKITLEKYKELKKVVNEIGFELEVSWDISPSRFDEFKFPFYATKKLAEAIDKQVYKLYPSASKIEFSNQLLSGAISKGEVTNFYDDLKSNYNIQILWADGNDNLLLLNSTSSDGLVNKIFDFKRKTIDTLDYNLGAGWWSEANVKEDIRKRLPFVDVCFAID